MDVLSAHMSVYHTHTWYTQSAVEGVGSSGTGVADV